MTRHGGNALGQAWRARSGRLQANASGAIYGTILGTAVIAASEESPGTIALTVVVTLLVFWLAHAYTVVLEQGLEHGRLSVALVWDTAWREFTLVEAPAISVVILLLGAVGVLGAGLAVNLALANGVVQLFLWGVAVARRRDRSWWAASLVGLVSAAFGLVLVVLKVLTH
jgi:hypothetical protein